MKKIKNKKNEILIPHSRECGAIYKKDLEQFRTKIGSKL